MSMPIADCRLPIAVAQTGSLRHRRQPGRRFLAIGNSAFTLIELMVVVGIIGLMAAMGLPSIFKALQKEGLRKAVSDIQDACFSAREQAIVGNKPVAVVFVPRDRRFGVEGAASGGSGSDTVNTHSGKTLAATLPSGVEIGALSIYRKDYTMSDWAKIFFNPDGTSDEAIIVLVGKGGQSEKITVEYATGVPVTSAVDQ
jgi:prepilin-type N-terminal cleavage/methylation domain-containing protein